MSPLLFVGVLGCAGNIREQYNRERDQVLQKVGAPSSNWKGDLRIRIRPESLQTLTTAAMDAGLLEWKRTLRVNAPLGVTIQLRPDAEITRLSLDPGVECRECLSVKADLRGRARWEVGPLKGNLPFTAQLGGDVELALGRDGDAFQLRGRIAALDRLTVKGGNVKRIDVTPRIKRWVQAALDSTPPFTIARFGGKKLPLRGARLRMSPDAVTVEALSNVNGAPVLASSTPLGDQDWELRVSAATTLALLRREAFDAGTQSFDIAIDPRALSVNGDRFNLGLRLWRLSGRGWWREYDVNGRFLLKGEKIAMEANEATEKDRSRGAGFADPIALLVRRQILDAITDNLQQALPGSKSTTVQDLVIKAQTRSFAGEDDALVLKGALLTKKKDD